MRGLLFTEICVKEVEEFLEGLLHEDALQRPCDTGSEKDLQEKFQLPEWFDEQKYNNGRRFFWEYCYGFSISLILGLMTTIVVPSSKNILMGTRCSNSPYTAYYRYRISLIQSMYVLNDELKPGSTGWRTLQAVRRRHLRVAKAASLLGRGTISQQDLGLATASIIGLSVLRPEQFGITQTRKEDWEGYIHFWGTVAYMLGQEDRYNICRKNFNETREVCLAIQERVFIPCLENVPEHYEHMARVMLEGLGTVYSDLEIGSFFFLIKYLHRVPGYVLTEEDRINFQKRLKDKLNGKSEDEGVDTESLICKSAVKGLPERPPRLLYVKDFDTIEITPAYRQLNFTAKYRLAKNKIIFALYSTKIGRLYLNLLFILENAFAHYFPYKAFLKFGIRNSFVRATGAYRKDNVVPKLNVEFSKPMPIDTWYTRIARLFNL